jgi:hypothetical protein
VVVGPSTLGVKTFRTSRKLAAARNFFAVPLGSWACQKSLKEELVIRGAPRSIPLPILAICACKDAQREVLNVRTASQLVIDSIVRTDIGLHLLEAFEKIEKEGACTGILKFEPNAKLSCIIGACGKGFTT